jgi:hypothetical protein
MTLAHDHAALDRIDRVSSQKIEDEKSCTAGASVDYGYDHGTMGYEAQPTEYGQVQFASASSGDVKPKRRARRASISGPTNIDALIAPVRKLSLLEGAEFGGAVFVPAPASSRPASRGSSSGMQPRSVSPSSGMNPEVLPRMKRATSQEMKDEKFCTAGASVDYGYGCGAMDYEAQPTGYGQVQFAGASSGDVKQKRRARRASMSGAANIDAPIASVRQLSFRRRKAEKWRENRHATAKKRPSVVNIVLQLTISSPPSPTIV